MSELFLLISNHSSVLQSHPISDKLLVTCENVHEEVDYE